MLQETSRVATNGARRSADKVEAPHPSADLVLSLLLVGKQTRALLNLKLHDVDLVAGQEQMLLSLAPDGASTVSELAEVLTIRASTVSKMLDRLEEKGFVVRFSDPSDARKSCVRLSPAGLDMQVCVRSLLAELEGELRRSLEEKAEVASAGIGSLEKVLALRLRRLR